MTARILVVDDEKLIRWSLCEQLVADGYDVDDASDIASALDQLETTAYDMALLDLKLPDGNGLDLLQKARALQPDIATLIITAHSSVDTAVEAMKQGAFDYISKPFILDEISIVVKRALETRDMKRRISSEVADKKNRYGLGALLGEDEKFQAVKYLIWRLAKNDTTSVLLLGETGTGKDMIARAIHYESPRADKPFMNITCTAMPETLIESELFGHEKGAFTDAHNRKIGLFEQAHNGTVFLDEIGDMPLNLQARLLRVLEEKSFRRVGGTKDIHVDCRILAATNRDLDAMIKEGRFREDLYYRLSTVPVPVPSLRERPVDIPLLANAFMTQFAAQGGRKTALELSTAALLKLKRYSWPGNVRELRNVIERAVLLSDGGPITDGELMLERGQNHDTAMADTIVLPDDGCDLADVEQMLVQQALERTGFNQTRAAKLLHITRDQIRYKMAKFGLEK